MAAELGSKSQEILNSEKREDYRLALEGELRDVFAGRQGFLYDMLRYHLGWVDEQGEPRESRLPLSFQPVLALAVCRGMCGDAAPALPAAAGVELVRNFILVHGEVQSNRIESQERPSVWWAWGPAQAINAGDGLHALGRTTIMRLAQRGVPPDRVLRAVETMDRACLALCEGQFLDLDFRDQTLVTSASYFHMAELKSGSLTACSAELGAVAAGTPDEEVARFREFGKGLGVAWQAALDVADLWGKEGGGVSPGVALNKKKGLPLVYALESGSTTLKRELSNIYMKRVLEPQDVSKMVDLLDQCQAREFAAAKAEEMAEAALSQLDGSGLSSEGRDELESLAQWALSGGA